MLVFFFHPESIFHFISQSCSYQIYICANIRDYYLAWFGSVICGERSTIAWNAYNHFSSRRTPKFIKFQKSYKSELCDDCASVCVCASAYRRSVFSSVSRVTESWFCCFTNLMKNRYINKSTRENQMYIRRCVYIFHSDNNNSNKIAIQFLFSNNFFGMQTSPSISFYRRVHRLCICERVIDERAKIVCYCCCYCCCVIFR